jgi:hypothetical protein
MLRRFSIFKGLHTGVLIKKGIHILTITPILKKYLERRESGEVFVFNPLG